MKVTYDPRYNIAYIRLSEKTGQVNTIKISDGMNIDMSSDGTIYGIELLNANNQLKTENEKNIMVVNEATGKKVEIPLG